MKRLSITCMVIAAILILTACDKVKSPAGPSGTPIITTFSADVLTIKTGNTVTLRWDVSGENTQVRIDPMVGNVPSTGSTSLILTATTVFTLNARAPNGLSAQRSLTVIVTP